MNIDFETLFKLSPNPYVVLDAELRIVWMNDAYLRVTMRDRDDITGVPMFEAFPSEPGTDSFELLRRSLERVLVTGEVDELALIRYDIIAPDGTMDARLWSATHTPLVDGEGKVAFILQHTVDVTELENLRQLRDETGLVRRANAVQARNADLLAESERLRMLFEQAPGFMAVLSGPTHRFLLANATYKRLVGAREIVGKTVAEALPEVVEQGFITILDRVRQSGDPYFGRGDMVLLASENSSALERRYLDFIYQPIQDDEGNVTGVFVQGHDVTEEFVLLQRQELLINELNHRVKNTLAIVQGLAAQSFRGVDPTGAARLTFHDRLKALATAHDLLTERNWEPTLLGDTVRMAIDAAVGLEANRVRISGPDVLLAPQNAVALAMAMHELSTNAIKYGSLSNDAGQVAVTWKRVATDEESSTLIIDWVEQGGPRVTAPTRKGFGTRLIERGLVAEMEGRADIEFRPEGLRCRITLSLPEVGE
ncbi:sensor histidine kinase [Novosphingobium sp. M1R2S20]|uniref:histidine kinase n=1 Tax=Novosphingobium rhizovicinum TaxID=3228928 RepID=A0ABV3RB93_9SPHN